MAVNLYEGMFIVDAARYAEDAEGVMKAVRGILERYGAEVLIQRPWDVERRLAYAIGKHKKGQYLLTYFRAEGDKIPQIERDCAINETIVRQLILKVKPQLADYFLEQASKPEEMRPAEATE